MECFDISNISSTHIVASMVRFRDGVPDRANYRRYRIKGTSDPGRLRQHGRGRAKTLLAPVAGGHEGQPRSGTRDSAVDSSPDFTQQFPAEYLHQLSSISDQPSTIRMTALARNATHSGSLNPSACPI